MLKCAGADGKYGSISVVGPLDDAFFMAEEFLSCDRFDNVDGRGKPDGLPDFSGETLTVISDEADSPYSGYVNAADETHLREVAVWNFLSALDTVSYASQYDREHKFRKTGAKVAVLASSYLSAYGYADIQALDSKVKVISPVHSMFRYALEKSSGKEVSIGVWTTDEILGSGIYSTVASGISEQYPSMTYSVLCPARDSSLENRILTYLRLYRASGADRKLDAVLVDDLPLKADELNDALDDMRVNADDSLAVYWNMLSDSFGFVDARMAASTECMEYLRSENQFTHRIAYPKADFYVTVPETESSSGVPFLLVGMTRKNFPDTLLSLNKANACKIYEAYVSE